MALILSITLPITETKQVTNDHNPQEIQVEFLDTDRTNITIINNISHSKYNYTSFENGEIITFDIKNGKQSIETLTFNSG